MSNTMTRRRTWGTAVAAVALASTTLGFVGLNPAEAAKVKAQAVPVGEATYGGYGSGVVAYANVGSGNIVAQTAVSNGEVASKGLTLVKNELGETVQAATAGKNAGANGQALTARLGGNNIKVGEAAVAEAAPSTGLVDTSVLKLPVPNNLAFADALNGQAQARWVPNDCILGADLTYSRGQAANAQLVGSATTPTGLTAPLVKSQDPSGERAVDTSITRQRLVAQTDRTGKIVGGDLGFLTEVRQTLAPATVTMANGVTIFVEVAGTYTLRAFSGGLPGTSFVTFNPEVGNRAPLIRITVPATSPLNPVLKPLLDPANEFLITLNQLAPITDQAKTVLAAIGIDLTVAEQPRAIGDPKKPATQAADGTLASGAVDVVRLKSAAEDIRFGHMEATAAVPVGGVECPGLKVAKTTDKDPVAVGETFKYSITVTNPYDCTLTNVKLVDTISADKGITFSIGATDPSSSTVSGNTVTFADIGPIAPKGSKTVTIDITVKSAANPGRISDTAVATADCAVGDATGKSNVKVNLKGQVTLVAPQVTTADRARGVLPRTGGEQQLPLAGGLLFAGLAIIETVRRKAARSTS